MAAGGFKTFTAGDVLTAADTNDFLMQGILVFDDDTARDAAVTSPVEGQFCFLKDTDTTQVYDGTDWVETGGGALAGAAISSPAPTGDYVDGGVTYDYWTFTSSSSITVSTAGLADVLVVGGGGGGATGDGGGGGAGGMNVLTNVYIPAGSQTVTVGAGGVQPGASAFGNIGNTSSLYIFRGLGGGGGGRTARGGDGGSGGGGGGSGVANQPGGKAVDTTQGNNGGQSGSSTQQGAGGGGAGAAAATATAATNNPGGAGLANSITGTSVTYAAGGNGDSSTEPAPSGTANTGNGGHGRDSSVGTAGAGGSGIVIVRYPIN